MCVFYQIEKQETNFIDQMLLNIFKHVKNLNEYICQSI